MQVGVSSLKHSRHREKLISKAQGALFVVMDHRAYLVIGSLANGSIIVYDDLPVCHLGVIG